jgi:hypothetical protein
LTGTIITSIVSGTLCSWLVLGSLEGVQWDLLDVQLSFLLRFAVFLIPLERDSFNRLSFSFCAQIVTLGIQTFIFVWIIFVKVLEFIVDFIDFALLAVC